MTIVNEGRSQPATLLAFAQVRIAQLGFAPKFEQVRLNTASSTTLSVLPETATGRVCGPVTTRSPTVGEESNSERNIAGIDAYRMLG